VNTFELEIWDDESSLCTFYTVRNLSDDDTPTDSETEKFFLKFENVEEYADSARRLLILLFEVIGEKYGAEDVYFNRFENEVVGLPPQGKIRIDEIVLHYPHFPLRLYALKITNEIVILFNGGVKDGPTNQTSSLHSNWLAACRFAKKIEENLRDGTIVINEQKRVLEHFDGTHKIIL
jgi:hypothetical protein